MTTPSTKLLLGYVLDDRGRIVSTREPGATPGPLFTLIRSASACAWGVRQDVPGELADALEQLAREEPASEDLQRAPRHAARYVELVRSAGTAVGLSVGGGPAFTFPAELPDPGAVVRINDEAPLQHHFQGWVPGEIAEGRAPLFAIVADGHPVSVCFCARRTDFAAEAGLDTAEPFRGLGYGPRVTAAWARAVRASGREPLYSTGWDNLASRAVARKLGLGAYASTWSIGER